MSEETRIRCGDIVRHRPSGEEWVVAYADYDSDELSAFGWPDSIARLADCDLVRSADDVAHLHMVQTAGKDGRRGAIIQRLYGASVNEAKTRPTPDQDLWAAYRSGQMSEAQWHAHVVAGDVTALSEPRRDAEAFWFNYRNYRGEISLRNVLPRQIWFGTTAWHKEPQWFLKAVDLDKYAERDFAMRDILILGAGMPAEILRLQNRAQELLEANNRYLEEARTARAERDALYGALIATGNALGAALGEGVSIEFLMEVPKEAALVVARLRTEAAGAAQPVRPDFIYNPADWETTCTWDNWDPLVEDIDLRVPLRLGTLFCGPDKWVAAIPLSWDDDGTPDERETRMFDSEAAAKAALEPKERAP